MIRIPDWTDLTEHQQEQLQSIVILYTAWSVTSAISYFYILSDENKWVAFGPVVFLLIAFVVIGLISLYRWRDL